MGTEIEGVEIEEIAILVKLRLEGLIVVVVTGPPSSAETRFGMSCGYA